LGQEKSDKIFGITPNTDSASLIADEKMNAVLRMVTRLQAEGVQILQSKLEVLKIVEQADKAPGSLTLQESIEQSSEQTLNK